MWSVGLAVEAQDCVADRADQGPAHRTPATRYHSMVHETIRMLARQDLSSNTAVSVPAGDTTSVGRFPEPELGR
jgi:hypothetical protein